MSKVFWITLLIRLPVVFMLWLFRGSMFQISRDSAFYDSIGRQFAELSATQPLWWIQDSRLWIDDGWKAFFGVLYTWFGPHLVIPMRIIVGLALLATIRIYLVYVGLACIAVCLGCVRLAPRWRGILQTVVTAMGVLALVIVIGIVIIWRTGPPRFHGQFKYFNRHYINYARMDMNRGRAKLHEDLPSAVYGENWAANAARASKGVVLFCLGVDPTNIRSLRQLAAVPEMLLIVFLLPSFVRGVREGWSRQRRVLLPILVFSTALVCTYGLVATNLGAMFRWRVQVLPFYFLLAAYGAWFRETSLFGRLVRWSKPAALPDD